MLEVYKFEKRFRYPHMKPNDIAIWERFIEANPEAYDTVQYDVGIGDIPQFMEERSSREGQAMKELYRLKIDVLAFKDGRIDLIEVKNEAGSASIGQVVGYVELYKRDFKPTVPVQPVLLTNVRKPNMDYLTSLQGVKLIIA